MRSFIKLSIIAGFFIPVLVTAQTQTLPLGWSIVGNDTGAAINTDSVFGNAATPTAISSSVTTVWTWNNALSQWKFYSPSMTAQQLSTYAASKDYGVLSSIAKGEGFWVNAKNQFLYDPSVTANTAASAEGFWVGTTANGTNVNLAILENGETWGLYGSSTSLTGAVYGVTSTSGTSLSCSGYGFNFVTRTSGIGTFTGNVTTKGNINFYVSDGTNLTGAYDASYEQQASVASIAGTYIGWAVTGGIAPQATTVVVNASGSISSSFVYGSLSCTTTGKATPRATGKNVFNVQLSFAGNYCSLGNGAVVNGVATYNAVNRQLITMALNSAKSDGLIYLGTR